MVTLVLALATGGSAAIGQDYTGHTGAQLFAQFCASCHGATGRGDGPVAPALKVEVPDLTRLVRRPGDPFPTQQVRRIVDGREVLAAHGARRMPVWGYEFATATASEPDAGAETATALVDRLVAHLATLQRQAPPPVPIAPTAAPRPRQP
ncbi:MAG: cytochrome c [Steroidobacteraceae bacterium]|jgi:mono/diheme cytochrome c family protein|nr:cytochrome c [Steroidobacteraceae bacterium]